MRDNPLVQGKFRGVNMLCRTCIKECKQFENVKIIRCFYVPKQSLKKKT